MVREQLDAAWGYPNADTLTATALPSPGDCQHDSQGRLYLAVDAGYCEYVLPAQMLPQLLDSGAVEEISESEYRAALPQVP